MTSWWALSSQTYANSCHFTAMVPTQCPQGAGGGGNPNPNLNPRRGKGSHAKGSHEVKQQAQVKSALFPGDRPQAAFLATRHHVWSTFFGRSISAFPLIINQLQVNIMQIMRKEHWIPIATYHLANILIISNGVSEFTGVRPNNAWNAACICVPLRKRAGPATGRTAAARRACLRNSGLSAFDSAPLGLSMRHGPFGLAPLRC